MTSIDEGANEQEASVIAMGQRNGNAHVVELSGGPTVPGRRRIKTLYRSKKMYERKKKMYQFGFTPYIHDSKRFQTGVSAPARKETGDPKKN